MPPGGTDEIVEQRSPEEELRMETGDGPVGSAPGSLSPRRKPPGPNPLFFATIGAVLLATVGALTLGEGGHIAGSNAAFKFAAGAVVFGVLYAVIMLVWLAWQRRVAKVGLPLGTSVEESQHPEDQRNLQESVQGYEAMKKRAESAEGMIDSLTQALERTTDQVTDLSGENRELRQEAEELRAVAQREEIRVRSAKPERREGPPG